MLQLAIIVIIVFLSENSEKVISLRGASLNVLLCLTALPTSKDIQIILQGKSSQKIFWILFLNNDHSIMKAAADRFDHCTSMGLLV